MRLSVALALVGVTALSAEVAAAAAITLNTGNNKAVFTVECPSGCEGLVGAPNSTSWSATSADSYNLVNAQPATVAAAINGLLGTSFTAANVVKTDVPSGGNDANFSYGVVSGYFFAKYGQLTSFFRTSTAQTVTFKKVGGGPGGLSNYGTIAVSQPPSVVPLPAAGWGLIAGLGALVALKRRRKAA